MGIFDESDRIRQNLNTLKKESQQISIKERINDAIKETPKYNRTSVSRVMNRSVAAWTLKGCDTYEKLEKYLINNPDKIAKSQILI